LLDFNVYILIFLLLKIEVMHGGEREPDGFLVALTFGRDTQPITVAIFSQFRQFGSNIDLIAPAAFISLAIPLAVFFAFQRYFVQGLLAGSVK